MSTPTHDAPSDTGLRRVVCTALGVAIGVLVYLLLGATGLSPGGRAAASVGALMAAWWVTEALPLEVTGLVPLALFPVLGVSSVKDAASPYGQEIIFLFLGGMLLGQAMERWGLHRRFALAAIAGVGPGPARLVGAFLFATAFISMWVSNTAATVMMLPIGASVVGVVSAAGDGGTRVTRALGPALVLAIAFGATIGGVGTVIGTPPIAQFAAHMRDVQNAPITFGAWLVVGLPTLAVALPAAWLVLTRVAFRLPWRSVPGVAPRIASDRAALGPWTTGERRTLVVFVLAAASWVAVPLLAKSATLAGTAAGQALARTGDATIAMLAAVALFAIPSAGFRSTPLLTWREGERVPWGVLLLFGGGLSLAEALKAHGVDTYLAGLAGPLASWPPLAVLLAFSLVAIVLTEFASNTALVAAALPVAGAIAQRLGLPPAVLLATVTLSASLGFMMPGGTAPNALVFASGRVRMRDMMRAGFVLDVLCGVGVPLLIYALWKLGFMPGVPPAATTPPAP